MDRIGTGLYVHFFKTKIKFVIIIFIFQLTVAVEKMDILLSSETAWSSTTGDDNSEMDDDVRLTECGEGFLQMLLAITDRYKILPQPGHK